jgi:hypothetical protein
VVSIDQAQGKTLSPKKKKSRIKKAGGMAQALQGLSSKCEVLSSNPNTLPPPKKKELKISQVFKINQ